MSQMQKYKMSVWVWKLSVIKCHLKHKSCFITLTWKDHTFWSMHVLKWFLMYYSSKEWRWSSEFVTVYSLYNSPESRISNAWVSEWAFMCVFWGRVTTERCGGGAWCLTTCFVWISIATMTDTSKREGHHSIQNHTTQELRRGNRSIFLSKISIYLTTENYLFESDLYLPRQVPLLFLIHLLFKSLGSVGLKYIYLLLFTLIFLASMH